MDRIFYVIQFQNSWLVKVEGKQTPLASYPRKEEAIKRGIAEARMNEAELIIEHENGKTEIQKFSNQPAI
jgi:hypothetical protein